MARSTKKIVGLAVVSVVLLLALSSPSWAVSITPGGSVNVTVFGTTEIYRIFGHVLNDPNSTPAIQIDFAAGANNVFTLRATGMIGCCGGLDPSFTPDGSPGGMSITGANSGLSSLSGNTRVPLVGVFVNADPFGNPPPPALAFNASSPTNLAPLLNQVFYIGDGLTGFNDPLGALLQFTAPAGATKLFLGVIDSFGFGGATNAYSDNPGQFAVTVNLLAGPGAEVPEPGTLTLLGVGVGVAGLAALRRRARRMR